MVRTLRILAMLLLCVSLAAEEPAPAPRAGMVITVEREAIPREEAAAAVTVLDRQQLDHLPATSLEALLAYAPGITMMFDSGTSGAPMITSRGFFGGGEVEYVKLLVDGVPAGDPESGNADWRRYRTAAIERVEVLHGPGSSLYGDTALGGVVQLFTRDTLDDGNGLLTLQGGSFGTRELDASYITDLGAYRFALHAGSAGNDGFREHAGASDRTLQLSLARTAARSRWRLEASAARKDRREPGPLLRTEIDADRTQSSPLFRFDRDETGRRRISATYEQLGATEMLATVHASSREGDTKRTLLLAPGFGSTALRTLDTRTFGTTFEAARDYGVAAVRGGIDLDRASLTGRYASVGNDGEAAGIVASQRGRRDRAGLFLTGAWNVCAHCRVSAGLRRDELRDDFGSISRNASAWSPRVGLTISFGGASAFVQLSRAFKAPTLDQLFDPRPYPDGAGGTFTVSNPELRPQRARNVEAGISRAGATYDFSVVAYRMQVRDEIDFDPQTYSYRNIGSSLHRGIEASAGFAKTARISPRVTYAWTRVADASTPDRQLKNIPEHVAQLLLHATLLTQTSADVIYRWSSGTTLDDAARFATPDISRVDLRLARDFGRVRVHLDALNALDAQYSEAGYVLFDFASRRFLPFEFPAPGRMIRAGATWRF
ncbi:MAG: TonB-dependent receptor [Acidobacteriota bacterium]|nr:TonB-dependent receptor [Acidobacteriota bacterium]